MTTTFRLAILFVGSTLMLSVLGIIALAFSGGRPVPDILQNIASGALAGLIGLLVNPDKEPRAVRWDDKDGPATDERG